MEESDCSFRQNKGSGGMTESKQRYHPLLILFHLWRLLKNSIVFVIYLFVIKFGSDSTFIKYGRIIFFLLIGISIISIVVKWFSHKYKVDDTSFHLYKGLFAKSERTIPFSKIQNVNRRTTVIHRIFNVTSIKFETGMSDSDATVAFEAIPKKEADHLEEHITNTGVDEPSTNQAVSDPDMPPQDSKEAVVSNRRIHFKPTKKELIKASFTSFSFLVLIPIIISAYFKLTEIFHVGKKVEGLFLQITHSWWLLTIIVIVMLFASVIFGFAKTFLTYGKYEIASSEEQIFITKGIVEETTFTISKDKVQAIEMTQSLMKRLLGLVEVKLISAGGSNDGDEEMEINSLYPFLPIEQARKIISEILPSYEVTEEMTRLPGKSLWVRLFRPSWLWIFSTGLLFYFKPAVLGITQAWWILSIGLLLSIVVSRLLDFFHTSYTFNHHFIQFQTGGFTTSLFTSKRDKIMEVKISRNIVQRMLGLASIETVNRAKPVRHTALHDVPVQLGERFYTWYKKRENEIKIESKQ